MKYENNNCSSKHHTECGVMLMPLMEVLQTMHDDAFNAMHALYDASSSKSIRPVLQYIYDYPVDNRVPENIKYIVDIIKGNVRIMHTHDYTRAQMCDDLANLVDALEAAIAKEAHEENVELVRTTLFILADHAEEIACWLESSTQ